MTGHKDINNVVVKRLTMTKMSKYQQLGVKSIML